MAHTTLIEIIDLEKEYQMGSVVVKALNGISLQIQRSEFLAVTGPSGSGKTTLLQIIGGLDRPSRGRVLIDGTDITAMNENELTTLRRRSVGFVFQFFNLLPVLTAFENVELPMMVNGVDKMTRTQRARDLLADLGLADRMNHRPDELSGGEQQRVAIARAVANRPLMVLADEPTGDLDWETGNQVITVMRNAVKREGGTLVVVTHNRDIAQIADRRVELRSGVVHGIS
jgi:putative ABC transport system ATP-binding protein